MRRVEAYTNAFTHEMVAGTLLGDNPERVGFIIVNDSGSDVFVSFGTHVSKHFWTDRLRSGERFNALNVAPDRLYTGIISFLFDEPTDGRILCTEMVRTGTG